MLTTHSLVQPTALHKTTNPIFGAQEMLHSHYTLSILFVLHKKKSTENEFFYWSSKTSFCLLLQLEIAEEEESDRRNH